MENFNGTKILGKMSNTFKIPSRQQVNENAVKAPGRISDAERIVGLQMTTECHVVVG